MLAPKMKTKILKIRETLKHLLLTAVFSASIGVLLEKSESFSFLIKLSVLVVANLASPDSAIDVNLQASKTAVITIDDARYVNVYGERSPLDRCQLTKDLSNLLSKRPQTVAIDLDLSPLARESSDETICQNNLDQLLDKESNRLILLAPFPTSNEKFRETKLRWMQNRCKAGLDFADGTLIQSFGSVTGMRTAEEDRLTFAGLLHEKSKSSESETRSPICTDIANAATQWLSKDGTTHDPAEGHMEMKSINFSEVARSLALMTFDSKAYQNVSSLDGVRVVFGGSWGQADTFLTPLGNLPGAAIHGAALISLDHPVSKLSHLWGFCLDIVLGLLFGAIVKKMWAWYVAALKHDVHKRFSAASTAVLFSLVVVYLLVVSATMLIAVYLYAHHNIEIVPLLMALLMLVDGFINGPREELEESRASSGHRHQTLPKVFERLDRCFFFLKRAVFFIACAGALYLLITHLPH